ncbi:glycosyltransferase family 2 protein [Sphingomonas bacterium]|uniref:glycosyltransferase family 2 protein n=1 Tax=Sphingomonas bacterium TaxID=1895847 RepID=UPI0015763904|nr:glycosyltransferase family 2 protein [Sphingomonas bacterium]
MPLLDGLLLVIALVPLPATLMLAIEIVAGLTNSPAPAAAVGEAPPFTVIVPAHDEETGIARTVASLLADMRDGDRLLVVADNCTDATAAVAARAGAEVVERHDPTRRGKGYALEHGLAQPDVAATDVTLIVDADCLVAPGALPALAAVAARTGRPVQADYRLVAPDGAGPATRFRAFAIRIKNHLRLAGAARLGVPCVLTGSGMAFPRALLGGAAIGSGEIVEDLLLSVDLALTGHPAAFCPAARVTSPLPLDRRAAATQQQRWEAGFVSIARRFVGRLLLAGLTRRRPGLALMGLDLAVPPLSLLAAMLAGGLVLTLAALFGGASGLPALLLALEVALFVGTVFAAWRTCGRDLLSPAELLLLPLRVVAKLPFYLRLGRARDRGWVRTARDETAERRET